MKNERILTFENTKRLRALHIRPISEFVTRIRLSAEIPQISQKNPRLDDMLGEMLKRGSYGLSKYALEEGLSELGSELSISSDGGMFHISLTMRNEAVDRSLSILETVLKKPLFLSVELSNLKKEALQSLHELTDDGRYQASALFSRLLYQKGDHRFQPTLADEKMYVSAIDRSALIGAHRELVSSAFILSVSGPLKAYRKALGLVQKLPVSKDAVSGYAPRVRLRKAIESKCEFVPGKQNVELCIGGTISLLPGTPEFTAFAFGIDILGKRGGFAGRLMSTVREKEGLTYSIYSWLSGAHSLFPGHFIIGTFFTPKDIEKGIESTLREVQKIRTLGVSIEEVLRFKRLLLNQYTLSFESGETTLAQYHGALCMGFLPTYVEEYPERIEKVTAIMVSHVLKEYLDVTRLVFAGAGSIRKLPNTEVATRKAMPV